MKYTDYMNASVIFRAQFFFETGNEIMKNGRKTQWQFRGKGEDIVVNVQAHKKASKGQLTPLYLKPIGTRTYEHKSKLQTTPCSQKKRERKRD